MSEAETLHGIRDFEGLISHAVRVRGSPECKHRLVNTAGEESELGQLAQVRLVNRILHES